jgi:hypothetical protein
LLSLFFGVRAVRKMCWAVGELLSVMKNHHAIIQPTRWGIDSGVNIGKFMAEIVDWFDDERCDSLD